MQIMLFHAFTSFSALCGGSTEGKRRVQPGVEVQPSGAGEEKWECRVQEKKQSRAAAAAGEKDGMAAEAEVEAKGFMLH